MTAYVIDKNVPIPPPGNRRKIANYYPFDQMEIDDSILFHQDNYSSNRNTWLSEKTKLTGRAHNYGAKSDKKFVTRTITANSIRIWRIK